MRKHILLIWAICAATGLFAQDFNLPCGNINYKPEVQTVLLYADDNQLNDPIVPLSDMLGRLTLTFDIIDGQGEVLNYTFIHCTYDWQPTDIQRMQYASGFDSDRLDDYAFSRNTLIDYANYHLRFPKEDMMPLVSGNYLLIVYGDDLNDLYFTRRFMVVDEKVQIGATVPRYPDDLALTNTHQQLNVTVNMNSFIMNNTQQFSHLTIRQNGRWDNAAVGLQATYIYPDYLTFEQALEAHFEKEVRKLCKVCFSAGEREALLELICRAQDCRLIERVWRSKRFYRDIPDLYADLTARDVPLTLLNERTLKQLASCSAL